MAVDGLGRAPKFADGFLYRLPDLLRIQISNGAGKALKSYQLELEVPKMLGLPPTSELLGYQLPAPPTAPESISQSPTK